MINHHIIEITGVCNLSCCHCFRKYGNCDNMPVEDVLQNIKEANAEKILISGGDPLLHPDIEKILIAIKKLGKKVTMICNGTNIVRYDKLIRDTVDTLDVSLDWHDERHDKNREMKGLFNIIKHSLTTLKQEFPRPKINIVATVFKENCSDIPELIKCSESLADTIVLDRFIPYQDHPQIPSGQEVNALFKEVHNLKKNSKIEIQVYDPIYYTLYPEEGTSRAHCKVRLFTSNTGQFGQCPFHPSRFATIQEVITERENEPLPSECKLCKFKDTCHGGCPAIRLVRNGTLTKKDPYCIKK